MMIKTSKETVIDVWDWDELVQQTYGRIYVLQQQNGCQPRGRIHITIPSYYENDDGSIDYDFDDYDNDSIPEVVNGGKMGVSFKSWLNRDPKQKLNSEDEWEREHGLGMFWERNFYPSLQMVANDLYEKGLIEAGEYTINIDW